MKIGDKLIISVEIDVDNEDVSKQVDNIDFRDQFEDGTLSIYDDMEDALFGASDDEKIVVLEVVDFGSVSTNPKFKSEKPEPKIKKSK